jgi:hypothetical protein
LSTTRIALDDFLGEVLAHPLVEGRIGGEQRDVALGLAGLLGQLVDRRDDLLDFFVRVGDGAEELFLGDFFRAAFDHHHRIGSAGDDDFHSAALVLLERRIGDVVALLVASDANGGNVLLERDVADRKCGTGGADRDDVAIETGIGRKDRRDDLHVVAEAVREQRADGAIDLARAEDAVFRRPAFALDVTARDLAGRVHLLFVVAGEGEEVDPLPRFF